MSVPRNSKGFKSLVRKGKIEKVLELLENLIPAHDNVIDNKIVELSARYYSLRNDKMQGLTPVEKREEDVKINRELLNILDTIEKETSYFELSQNTSKQTNDNVHHKNTNTLTKEIKNLTELIDMQNKALQKIKINFDQMINLVVIEAIRDLSEPLQKVVDALQLNDLSGNQVFDTINERVYFAQLLSFSDRQRTAALTALKYEGTHKAIRVLEKYRDEEQDQELKEFANQALDTIKRRINNNNSKN